MASDAQIAANRRNAQQSTGPKTDEGKAKSSQNATTHGFYSAHLLLPGEDGPLLDQHAHELLEELQPLTTLEMMLYERILIASWKFRRSMRILQDLYTDRGCEDAAIIQERIDKQEAWQDKLQKQMDRACNQLRKLQKARREQESENQKQMEQMSQMLSGQDWSQPAPAPAPAPTAPATPAKRNEPNSRLSTAVSRAVEEQFPHLSPPAGR